MPRPGEDGDMPSDVSRTIVGYGSTAARLRSLSFAGHTSLWPRSAAPRVAKGEAWWSQTGSNRRPHACKARALPAELWPRNQKTNASRRLLSCISLKRTRSKWWAWEDLNFRPHAYQARALTN